MKTCITHWREYRRYRQTVRQLRALSPAQLRAHGIQPWQVVELACKASRI